MNISVFDIFKIALGPSSSHTLGPMKAATEFLLCLKEKKILCSANKLQVELYGSLALTGKGHGTDKAILLGLLGEQANTVDLETIAVRIADIYAQKKIALLSEHVIHFDDTNLRFHMDEVLPKHTNGMRFTAYDVNNTILLTQVYYSVGGGFIVTAENFDHPSVSEKKTPPYSFSSAKELLAL